MFPSLGQSHGLTGLGPAPQGPATAIQPPLCERGWLSSSPNQELSVLNFPLVNYLNIVCMPKCASAAFIEKVHGAYQGISAEKARRHGDTPNRMRDGGRGAI